MNDVPEFVTVPDAARRLGLNERTAQRYANKLADSDRQDGDSPQGVGMRRVRLSAMATMQANAQARQAAQQAARQSQTVGDVSEPADDAEAATSGDTSGTVGDASAGLIEQLRTENARLWAALEREQATVEKAQANIEGLTSELAQARRESQVMLGAVAAGRVQIGAAEPATETENSELQKASLQESATGDGGNGEPKPGTETAGFWARLFGRGK